MIAGCCYGASESSTLVREIAIHEAGHAVIAWAMGVKVLKLEIAGGEPLVDFQGVSYPNVAGWVINSMGVNTNSCFWPPQNDADRMAYRYYKARIEQELPILFAGVAAESVYSRKSVDELLTQGGKHDSKCIAEYLDVLRQMGMDETEVLATCNAAQDKAVELVNQYQWEITGIALILARWEVLWGDEFYHYMTLFTKTGRMEAC
ncbi:hypothetical protein [Yersinia enterocolitica]|uniref:hypothetical protein n=1 Tax=Yersinia enterocolitica TaxID=630 RepID=UPI001CA52274|nr:hypothetical protein [Yersinia enterocolitica]MBW5870490.1 hypothetical protein [Yersinia enterocolitica]